MSMKPSISICFLLLTISSSRANREASVEPSPPSPPSEAPSPAKSPELSPPWRRHTTLRGRTVKRLISRDVLVVTKIDILSSSIDPDQHGFLAEIMALGSDDRDTFPTGMSDLLSVGESLDSCFNGSFSNVAPSLTEFSGSSMESSLDCLSEVYFSHGLGFSAVMLEIQSSSAVELQSVLKDEGLSMISGPNMERKKKKKVEGMPSKNLMAERRRRKRLNDRLSMLISIVPKIIRLSMLISIVP